MKRIPIIARAFSQEVVVILGDAIENQFDVTAEDFPPGLPTRWRDPDENNQEKSITWVSNFRLAKKGSGSGRKVTYSVELDRQPGKLVAYDGNQVFAPPIRSVEGQRIQGDLTAVDPAIGWG